MTLEHTQTPESSPKTPQEEAEKWEKLQNLQAELGEKGDIEARAEMEKIVEEDEMPEIRTEIVELLESLDAPQGSLVENARKRFDELIATATPEQKELLSKGSELIGELTPKECEEIQKMYETPIAVLRHNGWKPDSFAAVADPRKGLTYLLYQDTEGRITQGSKVRCGSGKDGLGFAQTKTPGGVMKLEPFEEAARYTDGTIRPTEGKSGGSEAVAFKYRLQPISVEWENIAKELHPDKNLILWHAAPRYHNDNTWEEKRLPGSRGCFVYGNKPMTWLYTHISENLAKNEDFLFYSVITDPDKIPEKKQLPIAVASR